MSAFPQHCNELPRVLIVEDDELQLQVLASILTAAGFDVDTVANGLSAVWRVRERRYDVVLVDYRIPEIDGLATARLIADFMGDSAKPVLIALTATPSIINDREGIRDSAFDAVVEKSSDPAGLVSVIRRCLTQAPGRSAVQEAVFSMLMQDWLDYDQSPFDLRRTGEVIGPVRILVVEDDESQRTLLSAVLEGRGYIVETAADGLDAVRKMRENTYDLALIDYQLPEMDGRAAGNIVQNTMRNSLRPRLVGLTATPMSLNELESAAGSVFDAVVGKSSDLQGLLASIDQMLRSAPNPATRLAATLHTASVGS